MKQAVKDWCNAKRRLKRKPDNREAQIIVNDCERFFRSGYFGTLTGMDGKLFLQRLKEKHGY